MVRVRVRVRVMVKVRFKVRFRVQKKFRFRSVTSICQRYIGHIPNIQRKLILTVCH